MREFFDLQADPYETQNLLNRSLTSVQRNRLNYLNGQLDKLLASG